MLNTDAEVVVGRFNEGFKVTTGIYKRVDLITNWNLILGYSQRISEEELIPVLSTNILLSNFGSGGIFTNIQQVLPKQFTTDFYYGLTIGNNVRLTYNIAYKNILSLVVFSFFSFSFDEVIPVIKLGGLMSL